MIKIINFVLFLFVFNSVYAHAENGWTYISEAAGKEIGYVTCMATGKDGSVWVGSFTGLFRFKNNEWTYESEITSTINNIEVAPNGDVWICLYPDSLAKYNGNNWTYFHIDGALRTNDIDVDNNGIVWCATNNGVYKSDDNSWIHYTVEDGLKSKFATWISLSPYGVPWIRYGDPGATDNNVCYGASFFNGEKWVTFDSSTGLPSDEIYSIEFGPNGYPYISYGSSTDLVRGILYNNGKEWISISEEYTGNNIVFDAEGTLFIYYYNFGCKFVVYKNSTWTVINEFTPPYEITGLTHEIKIDEAGNIWLGTYEGVYTYFLITSISEEFLHKPEKLPNLTNYPNPFNPITTISYSIASPGHVSLSVYNITGQKVATIVNSNMSVGNHSVSFDGSNLASGVYFYRFEAGKFNKTGKMLLVK